MVRCPVAAVAEQSARTASKVAQEVDVVRDQREDRGAGMALTRREAVTLGLALAAGGMSAAGSTVRSPPWPGARARRKRPRQMIARRQSWPWPVM